MGYVGYAVALGDCSMRCPALLATPPETYEQEGPLRAQAGFLFNHSGLIKVAMGSSAPKPLSCLLLWFTEEIVSSLLPTVTMF